MILTRRKVRERDVQCVCASKKKERACVLCRVSMCAFMHMRQSFKQAGNDTYILSLICILTCCFADILDRRHQSLDHTDQVLARDILITDMQARMHQLNRKVLVDQQRFQRYVRVIVCA